MKDCKHPEDVKAVSSAEGKDLAPRTTVRLAKCGRNGRADRAGKTGETDAIRTAALRGDAFSRCRLEPAAAHGHRDTLSLRSPRAKSLHSIAAKATASPLADQGRGRPRQSRSAARDIRSGFPDRNELVAIISDETKRNPLTVMPPFRRNLILTEQEIDSDCRFSYTRRRRTARQMGRTTNEQSRRPDARGG